MRREILTFEDIDKLLTEYVYDEVKDINTHTESLKTLDEEDNLSGIFDISANEKLV